MDVDNEWELCKENVQPLRSGRRMDDLRQALKKDTSVLRNVIQEYEMQLRKTEGDVEGQLDVWYSYICWMEQNFATSHQETSKLMHRCCKHYHNCKEINQNEKYVHIWIKLSETMDDPDTLFSYLFDQDIGTSLAIFYKSWAEHSEIMGATKKADELYNLGINRGAEPVDLLQTSKRDFEVRMAKKIANKDESTSPQQDQRKVLGALKVAKSGRVGNDRIKNKTSSGSLKQSSKVPKNQATGSNFVIYGEESTTTSSLNVAGTRQIKQIPISLSLESENSKPLEKLKGAKVKNTGTSCKTTSSKFEIFSEEKECDIKNSIPRQVVLSNRKPLSTRKEEKDTNPYKFYDPKVLTDPKVVTKYCKSVIYMGAREVSFAELKAQLPKYSKKKTSAARSKLSFDSMKNEPIPAFDNSEDIPIKEVQIKEDENVIRETIERYNENDKDQFLDDIHEEPERLPFQSDITMILNKVSDNNYGFPNYESTGVINIKNTDIHMRTPDTKVNRDDADIHMKTPNPLLEAKLSELDQTSIFNKVNKCELEDDDLGVAPIPINQYDIQCQLNQLDITSHNFYVNSCRPETVVPFKEAAIQHHDDIYRQTDLTAQNVLQNHSTLPSLDNQTDHNKMVGLYDEDLEQLRKLSAKSGVTLDIFGETNLQLKNPTTQQNNYSEKGSESAFHQENTSHRVLSPSIQGDRPTFQGLNNEDKSAVKNKNSERDALTGITDNKLWSMTNDPSNNSSSANANQIQGNSVVEQLRMLDDFDSFELPTQPISKSELQFQKHSLLANTPKDKSKYGFDLNNDSAWAPSPTVNTKNAISSVQSMFTSILESEKFDLSFEDGMKQDDQTFAAQFGFADSKKIEDSISQNQNKNKSHQFSIFSDVVQPSSKPTNNFNDPFDQPTKPITRNENGFSIFSDGNQSISQQSNLSNDPFSQPTIPNIGKQSGFSIFSDSGSDNSKSAINKSVDQQAMQSGRKESGFGIFCDSDVPPVSTKKSFQIFTDEGNFPNSHATQVKEHNKANMVGIYSDNFNKSQMNTKSTHSASTLYEETQGFPNTFMRLDSTRCPSTIERQSVTFSANVSDITTGMGFKKEEMPTMITSNHTGLNLSTIQERSNEDHEEGNHGMRKDSIHNETDVTDGVYRLVDAFNLDLKLLLLNKVSSVISTADNYLQIYGPFQKLQGANVELQLGPRTVRISKCILKGGVSATYKAVNHLNQTVSIQISKIQDPGLVWDFYISNEIHRRLSLYPQLYPTLSMNFIRHNILCKYSDSVCSESLFNSEGTLQDLIDLYKKHNCIMDEPLVMLYTHEILRIVHTLHVLNIIHANIEPKHFMQAENCELTEDGPLALRCLKLNGFDKSLDLTLSDQQSVMFVGSNQSENFECPEMRCGKPWKYQADFYGAAATIHLMLFQSYLNTYVDPNTNLLKVCNTIRSDWNVQLWSTLLSTLINTSLHDDTLPTLINAVARELNRPENIQKLDDAINRKNDLLMDDD